MVFRPIFKLKQSNGPTATVPEISRLYEALSELNKKPNTLTLAQFRMFAPLFQKKPDMTQDQLQDLGDLYCKTINFYKRTDIISGYGNNQVLLSLPPIFTPIRSMSPDKRTAKLVDINTKMAGHDIPRYANAALVNMVQALVDEQANNHDIVSQYRKEYLQLQQDFFEKYPTTVGSDQDLSSENTGDSNRLVENTTWEFEE